jgi:hypothetical protein
MIAMLAQGQGHFKRRGDGGSLDHPPCSRNAHDQNVLVRRPQWGTIQTTSLKWGEESTKPNDLEFGSPHWTLSQLVKNIGPRDALFIHNPLLRNIGTSMGVDFEEGIFEVANGNGDWHDY